MTNCFLQTFLCFEVLRMTTVNVPQNTNIQTFPHPGITPVDPTDQLDIETSTIKA